MINLTLELRLKKINLRPKIIQLGNLIFRHWPLHLKPLITITRSIITIIMISRLVDIRHHRMTTIIHWCLWVCRSVIWRVTSIVIVVMSAVAITSITIVITYMTIVTVVIAIVVMITTRWTDKTLVIRRVRLFNIIIRTDIPITIIHAWLLLRLCRILRLIFVRV